MKDKKHLNELHRLATSVAGKRRALENAIIKLTKASFMHGTGAADHCMIMLNGLALKLRDDEFDRLMLLVQEKDDASK